MRILDLIAILAASALVWALPAACAPSPHSADAAKVQAVIERSKKARTTYAVYQWQRITLEGALPREEWAAEFNAGSLHRVETVPGRVVANCDTMKGSYLSLATHTVAAGSRYADAACGIDTARSLVDQNWLGVVQTPFGKANRVRLVDSDYVRTYDINDKGVIVRAVYRKNAPGKPLVLVEVAVALSSSLPSGRLFDEASLQSSFVPDKYKEAPKLPEGALQDDDPRP
jgi:hypothetical protein